MGEGGPEADRRRGARRWIAGLAAAVTVAAALAGCGRMQAQEASLRLSDTTRTYAQALRWNEFEAARQYLGKREGEPREEDPKFLGSIRVTQSEVSDHRLLAGGAEALVTLRVSYYHVDERSVVTLTEPQRWWYEPEGRVWRLDGDLPDFAAGLRRGGP